MCVDALQEASKTNGVYSVSAEELRCSVAEMVENVKGAVGASFISFVKHHRAAPKEVGIRLETVTEKTQMRVKPKSVKKVAKCSGRPEKEKGRTTGKPAAAKGIKDVRRERTKPKPRKAAKVKSSNKG